jgi:hypothetical protein
VLLPALSDGEVLSHRPMDQPQGETPVAPAVTLRRNTNFRLWWTGQVLSDLGSQVGALAYTLLVYALTRSAVIAGSASTIVSVTAFAVRLPARALADRLDSRRSMIV